MTSVPRWAGPTAGLGGLAGLAAAALGTRDTLWSLMAGAGGALVTLGVYLMARARHHAAVRGLRARPTDFGHTLDLLRRAHGAVAAWAVGLEEGRGELEIADSEGRPPPPRPARERGSALVQLASVDGRTHVAREEDGTYVAVGDFPYGAGVLLRTPSAAAVLVDRAARDLRRLVAAMRLADRDAPGARGPLVARQLALAAAGAQTLEGVARAAAELAQQLAQRGAVVAIHEPPSVARPTRVIAVSSAADRRLLDVSLAPEAPVSRALQSGVPVTTKGAEDIFGTGVPERRRSERAGTAYPLLDGHVPIGALVVLGPPIPPDGALGEQLGRLVMELGPRLANARAVHDAEQRAVRDPLTDLANRREFDRVVDKFRNDNQKQRHPATLIYADLDRFKTLNDTLGHAAGDAALRHVADLLRAQIRDGDVVARIGGEEFAVWLPRTSLREGLEVAERIRTAVGGTVWLWSGTPYPLTTSCGVASYPEGVGDIHNLRATADAALYRAKQSGRNRVEAAVEKAGRSR